MNEELEKVSAVFRAPIESLIDEKCRMVAGSWVYDWDIPVGSKQALTEWGFPNGFNVVPDFQRDTRVVAAPPDAADFEVGRGMLYVLGGWVTNIGSSGSHLACVEVGRGSVLDIDFDPLPAERYPAWFWQEYPGHEIRNTRFIGSSVEKICELSWRWHSLWDVVHSLRLSDSPTEREVDTYFTKREAILSAVRREVLAVDPSVLGEPEGRYPWATVIGEMMES